MLAGVKDVFTPENMCRKPTKCCYPDCGKCPYKDCRYDAVLPEERRQQDIFDRGLEAVDPEVVKRRERQKRYNQSKKGKAAQKRYRESDKGIEARKRYQKSDLFKEAQKRYLQSEKGKETTRINSKKKILNGKNAEYCRAYYLRKKQEDIYEIKRN